ncbi:30S ribosomal protein S7 [Candidatus Woesearchaeota archaeon]|nr:30S ribosomal protein S7 [Candidatus Woesearchaeota archaeon]
MADYKVFNKWSCEGIAVQDQGLLRYITLEPRIVPRTGARYTGNRFHKSKVFIVERLINKLMCPTHKARKQFIQRSGALTGKGNTAYRLVEAAFERIEKQTKENPIKVFVKALENAAPREEIVTIEYGGARYPKAVDCAPQRRIDIALRYMTQGAAQKSFNKGKHMVNTLSDEIMHAYRCSADSAAIAKKNELERQADSSR